jgi:hypothetical protein
MPAFTFDSYQIFYFAHYQKKADITCYKGERSVGRIDFYADGEVLPTNKAGKNSVILNYPISEFSNIMNMLLHEKPLSICCQYTGQVGFIYTGEGTPEEGPLPKREPIGEEEP